MVFKVDGIDMTPYLAYQGFKWSRNDVDAPETGRTLDGMMQRTRVSTKVRLDITCRPLTAEEASIVLTAIMPVWVQVQYLDPQVGAVVTKTMYANNNPASYMINKGGKAYWNGITFPLVER